MHFLPGSVPGERMVDLRPYKRVSDPVHGIVELTELEAAVMSSKAFQRLHNVRQLGLAHYVFPAANYSRFAHSIGACHNAQRLLAAIQKNSTKRIPKRTVQLVRLAALVHDIGHYPFSHAFEHEIEEFYTKSDFLEGESGVSPGSGGVLDHEDMGATVLDGDPELKQILHKFGFQAREITDAFKKPDNPLAGILSSDLDCDRLDYLRRTAHHSGLPYGNVDINYIIDQATVDAEGRFCFGKKAIRAADHLLVSRYFDYLQVPYHKSVVALEWSLRVAIRELLERGEIQCDGSTVQRLVETKMWRNFDDNEILASARKLRDELRKHTTRARRDDGVLAHLNAILHRAPAKVVGAYEAVGPVEDVPSGVDAKAIEGVVEEFRNKHGLCDLSLHVWKPKDFALIKASTRSIGEVAQLSMGLTEDEPEYYEYVRIADESGLAKPIFKFPQALMNQIHNFRYKACRVYALFNGNTHFEKLVKDDLLPTLKARGLTVS